jgi:hypothetical protein
LRTNDPPSSGPVHHHHGLSQYFGELFCIESSYGVKRDAWRQGNNQVDGTTWVFVLSEQEPSSAAQEQQDNTTDQMSDFIHSQALQ